MTPPRDKSPSNDRSRSQAQVEVMAKITCLLQNASDAGEAVREVLEAVHDLVSFDGARLSLLDGKDKFKEFITVGKYVEPIDFIRTEQSNILSGWAIESKKSLLLKDRAAARRDDPEDLFATLLTIPLIRRSGVSGLLCLGAIAAGVIDEDDVSFLEIVADHLIGFIDSTRWQERAGALADGLKGQQVDSGMVNEDKLERDRAELAVELSSNINHAINNPLAVIVGNVQCLLLEGVARDQKSLSRLKRIEGAALELNEANKKLIEIRSLLSVEKVEPVTEKV